MKQSRNLSKISPEFYFCIASKHFLRKLHKKFVESMKR